MMTILIVLLILMLVGALPTWPHSANWGYVPSGAVAVIVVLLILMVVKGRIQMGKTLMMGLAVFYVILAGVFWYEKDCPRMWYWVGACIITLSVLWMK